MPYAVVAATDRQVCKHQSRPGGIRAQRSIFIFSSYLQQHIFPARTERYVRAGIGHLYRAGRLMNLPAGRQVPCLRKYSNVVCHYQMKFNIKKISKNNKNYYVKFFQRSIIR